jgi:hypothetical protein
MLRTTLLGLATSLTLAFINTQALAQSGTAAEARAMLDKAVAAVKADKAKALNMFIKGEGGFLENGLYPFCWNVSDGKHVATRAKHLMDQDIRILKDSTGKAFGLESYAASQKPEGEITEVSYMFPRPVAGTAPGQNVDFTTPAPKVSFVTRVGDLGCGVGYFK